jgi:hypothetical protein
MNDFELFMNFGAVVEIRRSYRDDLYKFCKLINSLGFLKEHIDCFISNCGIVESYDSSMNSDLEKRTKLFDRLKKMTKEEIEQLLETEYTDDYFWHLVDINEGRLNRICIEFQVGKGFTWGRKEDYLSYDKEMKVLSVDELISSCNKEDDFNLNYEETSFLKELGGRNEKLANELDDFCDWYEWTLVKYPNNLYNILSRDIGEFVGYFDNNENGTLRDCMERVFFRMVDYFTDEEEHEDIDYVEKSIMLYIELGRQYKMFGDEERQVKDLLEWLEDEKNYLKK